MWCIPAEVKDLLARNVTCDSFIGSADELRAERGAARRTVRAAGAWGRRAALPVLPFVGRRRRRRSDTCRRHQSIPPAAGRRRRHALADRQPSTRQPCPSS